VLLQLPTMRFQYELPTALQLQKSVQASICLHSCRTWASNERFPPPPSLTW
jgi:hypothetical protein